MPEFNRRGFLQFLGAAGATALMPMLPARAAVVGEGSVSKALWAGVYAQSGSSARFVGVARNMGLGKAAIEGVGARSVGVRVAAAATAQTLARVPDPVTREPLAKIKHVLEELVPDAPDDAEAEIGRPEDGPTEG